METLSEQGREDHSRGRKVRKRERGFKATLAKRMVLRRAMGVAAARLSDYLEGRYEGLFSR
jgi:hypothetical protein